MAKVITKLSKPAEADIIGIEDKYSEAAAEKRIKAIFQRIDDLEQFPLRGRPIPELNDLNVRQIDVFKEFRLIYHVVDEYFLIILRIFPYWKPLNPDEDLTFE